MFAQGAALDRPAFERNRSNAEKLIGFEVQSARRRENRVHFFAARSSFGRVKLPALLLLASVLSPAPQPPARPPELTPPLRHDSAPGHPEPPARPADLSPSPGAAPPSPPAAGADDEAVCARLLASGRVIAVRAPAIAGAGGCGIAAPVALKAVIAADGRRIEVTPAPVMRCDLAEDVARWIDEEVAPIVETADRRIARIATADAYNCRGRNGLPNEKLSEHGKGNALDMSALQFSGGGAMALTDKGADAALTTALRATACGRFSTVLGPGSDGFHETHIHLDLEARRHSGNICQWEIR